MAMSTKALAMASVMRQYDAAALDPGTTWQKLNVRSATSAPSSSAVPFGRDVGGKLGSLFPESVVSRGAASSKKVGALGMQSDAWPLFRGAPTTIITQSRKPTPIRGSLSLSRQECAALPMVDFGRLQNGSDVRGVAMEGVEGEAVNLSEAVAEAIAAGFAQWLMERKPSSHQLRVSIGHDSRVSAESLTAAAARGLTNSEGAEVVVYGLASTPAMFNSTIVDDPELLCPCDGAIMITASHLPFNRNGFKFFTSSGGLDKADIRSILQRAGRVYESMSARTEGSGTPVAANITEVDFMKRYAADLVEAVRSASGGTERPLEGFHIIVDAGNGAGGFFAGDVLEPLGANVQGSQFLAPDGMFPNHIPNPENAAAMASLRAAVLANGADLGLIFDTDVDRSAAVDSTGQELNRNRLIALMAAIVLEEHPGTTIVTDSVTSDGLTDFIEKKLGGRHHRFKRGYKNVINEGIRLNSLGQDVHLAIETSGHGAIQENHWLDDGAYLMVKLLIKLAKSTVSGSGAAAGSAVLTRMIDGLKEASVVKEFRFKIDEDSKELGDGGFKEYGTRMLAELEAMAEESTAGLVVAKPNYEGVRVSGFGGWFLLRLSLHDPVLPLNIEAASFEDAVRLSHVVLDVVRKFPAVDASPLESFLESRSN